jgi:uncharacterized protein YdaU (DUF1376 family)
MQFYVADYLADTMHLSAEEHGAYLLLMFNYWQTGKPIPKNRLAKIARVEPSRWASVEDSLKDFFVDNGNEWVHPRIERDLAAILEAREQCKKAGKASANARKAKNPTEQATERQRKANDRSTEQATESQQKGNQTETETETEEASTSHTPSQPEPESRASVSSDFEDEKKRKGASDGKVASISSVSTAESPPPQPDETPPPPSKAGAVCVAIRSEGMATANPQDPRLLALLAAGADIGEFVDAARICREKGKPFGYLLSIVQNRRAEASVIAANARASPAPPRRKTVADKREEVSRILTGRTAENERHEHSEIDITGQCQRLA